MVLIVTAARRVAGSGSISRRDHYIEWRLCCRSQERPPFSDSKQRVSREAGTPSESDHENRERSDAIVITTTDIHLPHRIAEAIRDAYKGELEIRYDKEGYFARVEWRRES